MDSNIIVAVIAFCGTLAGTFGGIMASNKRRIKIVSKINREVNNLRNSYLGSIFK